MGLFDSLRPKPRRGALAALLADYPPYVEPSPLRPGRAGQADAEANFAHFLRVKPERLARFGALIAAFGLSLDEALTAPDPRPFLDGLWRWTAEQWPSLQTPQTLEEAGPARPGPRPSPTLGMVSDTGILLGEMIVRRNPVYTWAPNLDPADREMESYRQPCVMRPPGAGQDFTVVEDPLAWARNAFRNCGRSVHARMNDFGQGVLQALAAAPPAVAASAEPGGGAYDKASYHEDAAREAGAGGRDAAAHIGVFVAWAVLHGLASGRLAEKAGALERREVTPAGFLYEAMDGKFLPEDLDAEGRAFADAYYGRDGRTPEGPSYLADLGERFPDFGTRYLRDGWESYDALSPRLDARFVAWRSGVA